VATVGDGPGEVVRRLADMTNARDLDGIVGCFAADYRNETPVHPARGFVGSQQVRRNWTRLLAAMPDLTVAVLDHAVSGSQVWSEWEHHGTRPDGSVHHLRGVIVFTVAGDAIAAARLFLEPVDDLDLDADAVVRAQVGPAVTT
jgi:hypothetical protein